MSLVFSSENEAVQYLADYINSKVLIAGYEDQKPHIIEKLKKHKSNLKDEEIKRILENIQKADPVSSKTKGKKSPFTEQIAEWYINNKIRFPEDIDTVKEALLSYSKFKGKIKKDIKSFNSPGDLRKELEQYLDKPEEKDYDDVAKLVATSGEYKMYLVENFDQGRLCFKDSGWCVQNEDSFNEYKPPYYMITKGKKRYALLHKDSYQLKDVHDNSLTIEQAEPIVDLIRKVFTEYKFKKDLKTIMPIFNLTEAEQLEIVRKNGIAIQYMKNPTEKVQLEAVKSEPFAIKHIKDPSEELQLAAVEESTIVIQSIQNPTEKVQLKLVSRYPFAIAYIKNPTEKVQLEAVKKRGYAIREIINREVAPAITPSEAVQLEAVKQDAESIYFIKNPSEAVQLEAVKKDSYAIKHIKNPTEKVKQLAESLQSKSASIKFSNTTEAVQYLADYTGSKVLIKNF